MILLMVPWVIGDLEIECPGTDVLGPSVIPAERSLQECNLS